jgi:drug/metabolite transporter (DMT)-like permease
MKFRKRLKQNKNKSSSWGIDSSILILFAGICWGVIGLFSKKLSAAEFSSADITFIRNAVAASGLFLYMLMTDKSKFTICIKDVWMFIATGLGSIVFFNIMYFMTITILNLSMAAILLYTGPFFVVVLSRIFFGEKFTPIKVVALIIASIGCILTTGIIQEIISGNGLKSFPLIGIVTGLCSGFGYALYSIFGKIALKKYHANTVTFYTFAIATLSLSPFCVNKKFIYNATRSNILFCIFGIGLLSTMLPFLLYTMGLRNVQPGKASIMTFIEPMVATIVGVFVFHEQLSHMGVVGIFMIFTGLVVLNKCPGVLR